MDVLVEEGGVGAAAGVLIGGERWYLFLDGITSIERCGDVWLIRHYNGHVIWGAASAITDDQMDYLRECMHRSRTPEGIQAVIERGRRIQGLMAQDRGQI